jgi:hypothetical protein
MTNLTAVSWPNGGPRGVPEILLAVERFAKHKLQAIPVLITPSTRNQQSLDAKFSTLFQTNWLVMLPC